LYLKYAICLQGQGQGGGVAGSMEGSSVPASNPVLSSLAPSIFGLDNLSNLIHAQQLQVHHLISIICQHSI